MEPSLTQHITPDAKTWREGYDAARHGLDSPCNPYEADQAETWLAGFEQGVTSEQIH
ncbi:MAG: hypothetical protein ABL907_24075 [Hyphomicrobium sp.]